MGLFEKTRNITDTDLRRIVQESDDPSEALRRHILSLEETQRQLRSSQGFLERQRQWLESSAERKLNLGEEWEKRAVTAAKQDRDDLARHALMRKKELLRSMSEDRRQLERIVPQLEEVESRLVEVRQKILKARSVRARFFEGDASGESRDAAKDDPARPSTPPADRDETELSERERQELEQELKDLKRRLDSEEHS